MSKIRPLPNPLFNVSTPDGRNGIRFRHIDVPADTLADMVAVWERNPQPSVTHSTLHGKERGRRSFDVREFARAPLVELIREHVIDLADQYNYAGRTPSLRANQALLYPPGAGCPVHCDDQDPADDEYGVGSTVFNWANQLVALLYVSTEGVDFEGGALYFPNADLRVHAERGKLVVFPAHYKYKHGVSAITSGMRALIQTTWRFDL